jgi:quinolinate synthase
MGDRAVPADHIEVLQGGLHRMLRLQPPLSEGYTTASQDALAARIASAKAALGSRLMILGHHYQRDEVMRWADARGDSFGLSRLAAAAHDA